MTALLIGALFAACVISTGYGLLCLIRLSSGATAFGLSPAAGLAVLIVASIWTSFVGLPPLAASALMVIGVGLGVVMAIRDRHGLHRTFTAGGEARLTILLVALSIAVPAVVLGAAFSSIVVPLSSDDGAHHVEIINQLRQGGAWAGWYPRGFHSLVAAFLQLMPSVDSALGAQGVGLGLALLAPISVFGFGAAVLKRISAAAVGAVVVGLTAQYPYHIQFWDGWPLAVAIVLAVGLWTIGLHYLERPSFGWCVFGALLLAGTVLTHGTELITAAIGLVFVLASGWPKARRASLTRHVLLALLVGATLTAPYVAGLLEFYQAGGAQSAAETQLTAGSAASASANISAMFSLLFDVVAGGFFDAPLRVPILLAGVAAVYQARRGRLLVALGLAFLGLAIAFRVGNLPGLARLYALTFPWGQDYRLLMIVAICASLLAGAGLVRIFEINGRVLRMRRGSAGVVALTCLAPAILALMVQRFATEATFYLTFVPDDAVALQWLGAHVRPGELVVNDGSADAGIWAPYKGGASILLPRVLPVPDLVDRQQVLGDIGDPTDSPAFLANACGLGARYVYVGASGTAYDKRQLPPAESLQQSVDLDEVFRQGAAAVFHIRCG